MGKLLGYVDYKDTETLKKLLEENGYETEYYNFKEFWLEAEFRQFETGSEQVEIIAYNTDYVLVNMEEFIKEKEAELESEE